MTAFGDDETQWARLQPLSTLVARDARRPVDADLTVFKAMGMGISDLSLGIEILRRVRAAGLGRPIAPITRQAPRLTLNP
jgi:ornithine cyclodeaminase